MTVQYLVGLCCVRRNPDAVEIMVGDMVMDAVAEKERDVDVTVTLAEEDGAIHAFKAYEVKREGSALDVAEAEQLIVKLEDMPAVTHRAIVSASGFTDAAIRKAKKHNVDLYVLRPWIKPDGMPMPAFSGEPLPLQLRTTERLLLCWGKSSIYLHLASGPASFTWEDQTELYSPKGVRHRRYPSMGAFRHDLLTRSTEILLAMKSVDELTDAWPTTAVGQDAGVEVTPLGAHTHTIDVAREEVCLRLGDALAQVISVSISGGLEWHRSAAVPDFRVMERVPDGEPFAGAALVPYGTSDGKLGALVFAPFSRSVGVHAIHLGERHRNAIRRLSLLTGDDEVRPPSREGHALSVGRRHQEPRPNDAVLAVLRPAYAPCAGLKSGCSSMRWAPERGHVPRGFCGATGSPEDVRLVLVSAEPGDPHESEAHSESAPLDSVNEYAYRCFRDGKDRFHRNIRMILDMCFPELSFAGQLRVAWITDSVLCSARVEGGTVPASAWRECRRRFLEPQLALFPNAVVAAVGAKARDRLVGVPGVIPAVSAAPPGCNLPGAKASWQAIADRVHDRDVSQRA